METSEKSLQYQLNEGGITKEIRIHLENKLISLEQFKPNSWDIRFIRDMITYKGKLSLEQKRQLERICPILMEDGSDSIRIDL